MREDFLYLIFCAVNEKKPEKERVASMELDKLYQLARFHTLTALVYLALEDTGIFKEERWKALGKQWKEEKEKAVRKNLLLDLEREKICAYMEENKIWYLPLKGILLKEFYPKAGMRQMADNDILYDAAAQNRLCDWMLSKGYEAVSVGRGNHDVYEKAPVYNYELHTALYSAEVNEVWEAYYRKVKERLLLVEGKHYEYRFSWEDFYLYVMTHAKKHHRGGGTGVRTMVDFAVFLRDKEQEMDWEYIQAEAEKLQISSFEKEVRRLSKKLFLEGDFTLDESEEKQFSFFLGAGTYGTMQNRVRNRLERNEGNKGRYLKKRFFPGEKHYKNYAPFAYRHKWVRPFYLIFRILRGMTIKRKKLWKELKILCKIKN